MQVAGLVVVQNYFSRAYHVTCKELTKNIIPKKIMIRERARSGVTYLFVTGPGGLIHGRLTAIGNIGGRA